MPLRSIFAHHFWLKLLSLVLASLIWLTVKANLGTTGGEATRTFINRPIMLLTDSAEHVAMVASPNQASVTVRGPALLIQEMADQDVHVYVRLHERNQLSGELPVHAHVPAGATVALVTPLTASVKPAAAP